MIKAGSISLKMVNPEVLSDWSREMVTIDAMFADILRNCLRNLDKVINEAIVEPDIEVLMSTLEQIFELTDVTRLASEQVSRNLGDSNFYREHNGYEIVISTSNMTACVITSPFTSKGRAWLKNVVDMTFPADDGEECYVLGPEWFLGKVPYDIKRRTTTESTCDCGSAE